MVIADEPEFEEEVFDIRRKLIRDYEEYVLMGPASTKEEEAIDWTFRRLKFLEQENIKAERKRKMLSEQVHRDIQAQAHGGTE